MAGHAGAGDDALGAQPADEVVVDGGAQIGRRRGQEDLVVAGPEQRQHVGGAERGRDGVRDGGGGLAALDGETDDRERRPGRRRALLLDARLEVRVRPDPSVARGHPRLLHHQDGRADGHRLARQHRDALPVREADLANLGPVDAADVLDLEQAAVTDVQTGVQARRERIGDADVGVVGPPDREVPVLGQRLREEQIRPHDQQMERGRRRLHRRIEQRR